MKTNKFKFTQELIFTILIIPTMISAIIKSFLLIPLDYNQISLWFPLNQYFLITIIFIVQQINILLAILSIVILLVNLNQMIRSENNSEEPNISNWAGWAIKICALSNMFVIWILNQANSIQTDLKPALILWIVTFALSLVSSLIKKLMRK
jgi:hypothetical protein